MPSRSISFIGRQSGDMECFCWDGVPIDQRKAIVGEESHAIDEAALEEVDEDCTEEWNKLQYEMNKRTLTRVYPGDVLCALGVFDDKLYRFTITAEPI